MQRESQKVFCFRFFWGREFGDGKVVLGMIQILCDFYFIFFELGRVIVLLLVLRLCLEGKEGASIGVGRFFLWGQYYTFCFFSVEVGVWFLLNREDGGLEVFQVERQVRIKFKIILEDLVLFGGWYTSRYFFLEDGVGL